MMKTPIARRAALLASAAVLCFMSFMERWCKA